MVLFLLDCLDLLDPVLTFDRLMGGIDLNKYLTDIPEYTTGRLRYNPVNMLKQDPADPNNLKETVVNILVLNYNNYCVKFSSQVNFTTKIGPFA